MEIDVVPARKHLPTVRAWSVSMVIRTFKGRKDVEVFLFRSEWDPVEETQHDWDTVLGDLIHPDAEPDLASSRKQVLESFTEQERDQLIGYLKDRYGERLAAIRSCPLDFPVPLGIPALSEISEGKDTGFIHFGKIPGYTLPFPVKGFFDLSQHAPMVDAEDQ